MPIQTNKFLEEEKKKPVATVGVTAVGSTRSPLATKEATTPFDMNVKPNPTAKPLSKDSNPEPTAKPFGLRPLSGVETGKPTAMPTGATQGAGLVPAGSTVQDGLAPVQPEGQTKEEMGITPTVSNDFITQASELDPEFKSVYDMLSDTEKKQYDAIGEIARKNGQDYTEAQIKYLSGVKDQKGYMESQRSRQLEYDSLTGEVAEIQSSQRLRAAKQSVDNMKSNIAYLGNMGAPATSMVKMNALGDQILEADKKYGELVRTEEIYNQIKDIGDDEKAEAYEMKMQNLQEDLDNKVNTALQESLMQLDKSEIDGILDSPEQIENFRIKLLQNLDEEISGITDANIQQRQFLIDRFDKIAQDRKSFLANKNSINQEMSAVQGFYVDGNGEPVISATTGTRIQIPAEAPMDPIFDQKTGRLITFSTDEIGNIVPNMQETYPQATFTEQAIYSYADLVNKGKIDMGDVPENIRNNEGFLSGLSAMSETQAPTFEDAQSYAEAINRGAIDLKDVPDEYKKEGAFMDMLEGPQKAELTGKDRYISSGGQIFDTMTGTYQAPQEMSKAMSGAMQVPNKKSYDLLQAEEGSVVPGKYSYTANGGQQCGEYINNVFGTRFGDSYENKLAIANQTEGNVNDIAVWQPSSDPQWAQYGHVGVIVGQDPEDPNSWLIKSSNIRGDGKISTDSVPKDAIGGYKTPDIGEAYQPPKTLADDIDIKVARIGTATYGKTISEGESERVQRIIENNPNSTDREISLQLRGITLKNPEKDYDKTMKYLQAIDMIPEKNQPKGYEASISNYMNTGDEKGLDKYVRKFIETDVKANVPSEEYISASGYKTQTETAGKIIGLIENNLDKLGLVEGYKSDWLNKVKDQPEYQELKTLLTMSQADQRKKFAGSAVTDTEMEALADFIGGKTTMSPGNLITMLETLNDKTKREYENQRSSYGISVPTYSLKTGKAIEDTQAIQQELESMTPEEAKQRAKDMGISVGGDSVKTSTGIGMREEVQDVSPEYQILDIKNNPINDTEKQIMKDLAGQGFSKEDIKEAIIQRRQASLIK